MLPHRLAVLVGIALAGLMMAVACSDDVNDESAGAADSGYTGNLEDSVCPAAAPGAGSSCLLPNGTTCAFGACGTVIARCVGGSWLYSGNGAGPPACPKDFPVAESDCPPCWSAQLSCTYGSTDCSAIDASPNTTVASCASGKWRLFTYPCGNLDAGADVQRDSAPDAD